MRRMLMVSLAALCVSCASSPPAGSAPPAASAVARVGASTVSADLFELRVHSALTSVAAAGGPTNNPAMVGKLRASVLRSLLIDTVIAQEARAGGVAATDAEIQAQLDATVSAAGGMSQLQTKLAALGGSMDQLRDAARSSLNEQHLEDFFARRRALEVEQALGAGQDFAALAAKYSDDSTTAAKGGALGTVALSTLSGNDPAYARAVLALAVGGHTDPPVRDSAGYDIVQLDARTQTQLTLRHVIVNAPSPYTVRERPQWFSLALFQALAADCAAKQIAIYVSNVGSDPCAAAAAAPPAPSATP